MYRGYTYIYKKELDMSIKNPRDKKIYDFIMNDMNTNGKNYSVLTNTKISEALGMTSITVRDKVLKLVKQKYFVSLIHHFDENDVYYSRKILKGNTPG
jgi:RecG-like helicase